MFIQNISIIKVEIFHKELSVSKWENCFCLLKSMKFHFKSMAKLCRSVSPIFWYLFTRPPSNLSDMTRGPTVFWEVDRSLKQIKFHLKS